MNRYLEHEGECFALKSIAIQADIQEILRPFSGGISTPEFLKELRGALQIANCIALAEKQAPYTKAPQPAPKSKDRKQIEKLLETHEPEITKYEVKYKSTIPELRIEFFPKDRDGLVASAPKRLFPDGQPPAPARVVPEEPKQFVSDGIKIEFVPHTPAPDHRTDKYLEVCGRGKRLRVSDMGITLDLRIPNNMRPTQVIDSSPINVKIGPSVIWIKYNAEKNEWEEILAEPQPEPESKASKPNQRKYKTLGFSGRGKPLVCMACGKDNCVELRQAQEEWEKFHAEPQPEPIKPEQLDPKACRQFVEQLLAFDELEKNRVLDIDRLLVSLLSSNQIGLLSYVLFLKGYTK